MKKIFLLFYGLCLSFSFWAQSFTAATHSPNPAFNGQNILLKLDITLTPCMKIDGSHIVWNGNTANLYLDFGRIPPNLCVIILFQPNIVHSEPLGVLAPGDYTVNVFKHDINDKTPPDYTLVKTYSFHISACDALFQPIYFNTSCPNTADGFIEPRLINAPPPVTYLWENGSTTATRSNLAPGIYRATITYNQGGCTINYQVTISTTPDTKPPVLVCKNISVDPDANGNASIHVNQVIASLTDNCPGAGVLATVIPSTFDCFHAGPNNVLVVASDVGGNNATCNAIVTVTHDADCDRVGNACDRCPGGNDKVDKNGDGKPDCAFFPGFDKLIPAWKCANDLTKVYICHRPPGNPGKFETICVSPNAVQAHLDHGDYIGPCGNAVCNSQISVQNQSLIFNVRLKNGVVELDWLNNTGDLIDFFVVERSADGQNFSPILKTNGAGATAEILYFNELDKNPLPGENFYRLKWVTKNGNANFSEIRKIEMPEPSDPFFAVVPNPAHDFTNLVFSKNIASANAATLQICDGTGRLVLTKQLKNSDLQQPFQINLGGFSNGVWFLKFKPEGQREVVKKFAVIRE